MEKTSKKKPQAPKMKRASRETMKAVKFFRGDAPASDLMIHEKIDKKRTPTPYQPTLNDKFFDWVEDKQVGKYVILTLTTAAAVAVMYWGIKQ